MTRKLEQFVLVPVMIMVHPSRTCGRSRGLIKAALASGYRLLDGAAAYSNEKEVGEALTDCLRDGICSRGEVFVVSKLFNTHHVWHGDRTRPHVRPCEKNSSHHHRSTGTSRAAPTAPSCAKGGAGPSR